MKIKNHDRLRGVKDKKIKKNDKKGNNNSFKDKCKKEMLDNIFCHL
jgi:hypothetical protein